MHVDVIKSRDMLLRVRSNWGAVYQAAPEAQFYMSWTWIAGWFEARRLVDRPGGQSGRQLT